MTLERMRAWAWELPEQLRFAVERATARDWPSALVSTAGGGEGAPSFVGGMGGSAVSAKISRALLAPELSAPIEVGSDPFLPAWVGRLSPCGLVSYSGNTWEVLALWEQLQSRGVRPWVVASGGELVERARAAGAPHLVVPSGYPPRAAFGWLLPPVGLALAAGLGSAAVESARDRCLRAADVLAEERDLWVKGRANDGRDPVALARALVGKRVAFVVSQESDLALAFRWKNQFEENAKQVSQVVLFPEASHNEIEGWSRLGGGELVLLETPTRPQEPKHVVSARRAALEALLAVAKDAGLALHRVPANGGPSADPWTGILSQVQLADAVSVQVAEFADVDPEPIPVLGAVKEAVRRETSG